MRFNRTLLGLSFIFIAMLCIGSAAAGGDSIDENLTSNSYDSNLQMDDNQDYLETVNENNSVLSSPQTIVVEEVDETNNEMTNPTIQKAIDRANAGDTIIIEGRNYVHSHFVVNKKLTIKSNVGTSMSTCPSNTQGSGYRGIFYISPNAGGTVIEGFTIDSNVYDENDYGILVAADDVEIRNCRITNIGYSDAVRIENTNNCLVENVTALNAKNALNIRNSQNINVKSSNFKSSKNGICIVDSSSITISCNDISNNGVAGVSFSGTGRLLTINCNNITDNENGIKLLSSDNVYILSNYIAFNTNNGVYVDYNITKIEIKGNFFNQNQLWEVFNDFHVKNINDISIRDANNLEVINNNYMVNYGGYGSGDRDRPVWTQVYEYKPSVGQYNYDATNDVYVFVGEGNGEYYGHQGIMYMGYVFEINEFVSCPNIYYAPQKVWSKSGNYELQLSEIKQVKKGIYSISIVDANGNVAEDLSSVPVTFYLNKAGKSSAPQEGDVYKTVMMKNGTATVRFYMDEFNALGNVITAVFPTPGTNIDDKVSRTLAIDDEDIPGIPSNTIISVSDLNTYPNSNQAFVAVLKDSNGKVISGATLTFTFNSRTYDVQTDANGKAQIKISAKEGSYPITVKYAGDGDVEYYGSSANARVIVKKANTKIISSNLNMIPKRAEYYSITLKDADGNVLANQKVTFKVNGKTYTKKTNSKGVAKIKLKFNKNKKTYKIAISFKGNDRYKAVSKTNKLIVKYSSKKVKLITPTVTIPPKTAKYYTVSLKDVNGKAIAKQKVIIKINGKKYVKKTNSKGQIKIRVKFSKLKSYKVKATYKGSKIYKKASSRGKIKVAKTTTKITAPSVSMLPKETKSYTVTLKAGSKSLSKQKLTVKVNGKTYTKTTDRKGQASVSVNFENENTYSVHVNYKGTGTYKASSATGEIKISKIATNLDSNDRSYSMDSTPKYEVVLKDGSGNALGNENIIFTFNGNQYTRTTDANGKASLNLVNPGVGSFDIQTTFSGSVKYKTVSKMNKITILNKTRTAFIDSNLVNSEIQSILDSCSAGENIEFLGDTYRDVNLNIKKGVNVYSSNNTKLYGKDNNPVFSIEADNVSVSGFSIMAKSNSAIGINGAENVNICNNSISNVLDGDKLSGYADATINMPGYGISVSNSTGIRLSGNDISLFESGIFAQHSSNMSIDANNIRQNNYGIEYGFGVANTWITNNDISEQIGLYTMAVPEGPSGYGIFLNSSAVNVTINRNHIYANHLGISIDSNHSTGIVITQNTITDSVLEGIRFNAGYDLAENAVEPHVTDNAIYRNARGPSMMILGELSANPFGIYGNGLYNPEDRLKLEPNWYGTNDLQTWDNDTGVVGYGTMCPRINTTNIPFNMSCNSAANYSIKFYKNGVLASNLPVFDMFATLNRGTENESEVVFDVIDGVGTFMFDASKFNATGNTIEISIGSLIDSTSRVFKVAYLYNVPESEIPV